MKEEKIFGLGLSRTGTTSLTVALKILGYNSFHYPDFYFNKYLEMKIGQTFLDKYDALTDVPVAHIYQKLDKQYPNAKFILTVRDEDSWIKSVKNFFTRPNGSRSNGLLADLWRFIKPSQGRWRNKYILRHFTYGSFKFDKKKYLKAYNKHNEEVINYFKDRTDKLLVIYLIEEQNKWEKLCTFLKRGIPEVKFPHSNNASSKNKKS